MATWGNDTLDWIFRRTDGNCHICGSPMAWKNYAVLGARGAWEVEHAVAKANGGTDHRNNLYAAHIPCNRDKGTRSSRSARSDFDRTRAPRSAERKEAARREGAVTGGAVGTGLGLMIAGPPGAAVGAVLGLLFGGSGHDD